MKNQNRIKLGRIALKHFALACTLWAWLEAGNAPAGVVDISNATTPAEPSWPEGGVLIDAVVGAGNTGRLVGTTQTHWWSSGFTVPLDLNGNTLILDFGWNAGKVVSGPISGNGEVRIQSVPSIAINGLTGNTCTGTTVVNPYTAVSLGKSSGDALRGTITVNGPNDGSNTTRLVWTADNQINDASDVSLVVRGALLDLAGFSDTINDLHLATGTAVQTGADGVLKVAHLFLNGIQQDEVAYLAGDGFVLGSVSVGAGSPYGTWASQYAGGGPPDGDSNLDGVQNGVAYFMGATGLATLPGVVDGKLPWPRDPQAAATFKVQVSENLTDWVHVDPHDPNLDTTNPNQVVYTLLPPGALKKFHRLEVTVTP
ncbi:MAG: hypothetical protein NTW21_29325 [Verrucomicrobia bacterium]|nr:hypothetical protein [Verrucomicrobiota bacterium]